MSAKVERVEIIRSGSPLALHSLNQNHLKSWREGEQKMNPSGKELRVTRRQERRFQEALGCERKKQNRIWERVQRGLEGYDGTDYLVLQKEMDYLSWCSISVESHR